MKKLKMYEPDDKMISLIRDNYDILQSLGSFGISLASATRPYRKPATTTALTPTPSLPW